MPITKTLQALREFVAAFEQERESIVDDFDYVTLYELAKQAQSDLYHLTRGQEGISNRLPVVVIPMGQDAEAFAEGRKPE